MTFVGKNELALHVPDRSAAERFYTETLGCIVVNRAPDCISLTNGRSGSTSFETPYERMMQSCHPSMYRIGPLHLLGFRRQDARWCRSGHMHLATSMCRTRMASSLTSSNVSRERELLAVHLGDETPQRARVAFRQFRDLLANA